MNSPAPGYRLGLDLGSISLNCVVFDPSGRIVFKRYERSRGRPRRTLRGLLERLAAEIGAVSFAGAVATGSGKDLVAGPIGIDTTNEILAHATGAWTSCPQVRSVIEIGGQDSKFIAVGRNADGTHFLQDHAFNELCAAGTGAFLDQQAERLGVGIEQFGAMAAGAGHVARMAGRCSVFAKSDMIHLQQKAVPADEIAAGLCYALARHYLAHLCRGRTPEAPVLFQGGVAANPGVVRAFRDLLNLEPPELTVPENFDVMGALGAAVIAGGRPLQSPLALGEMIAALSATRVPTAEAADLEPLTRKPIAVPPRAPGVGRAAGRLFMGIDVGSVSQGVVMRCSQRVG